MAMSSQSCAGKADCEYCTCSILIINKALFLEKKNLKWNTNVGYPLVVSFQNFGESELFKKLFLTNFKSQIISSETYLFI